MKKPARPAPRSAALQVGAASVEITPPAGTALAGNFRDDYASRGVHAPLWSRALVVSRGDAAVAIIVADLLTVPDVLARRVREGVQRQCGLRPEQVMVAATHTHSGPAVEAVAGPDESAAVIGHVLPGMVESCVKAFHSRRAMRIWAGEARGEGLFFNRRLLLKDGRTVMNWTLPPAESIDRPLGPVDDRIGVLLAGDDKDRPAVVVASAALHAAVLAGENRLLGPDWPGCFCRAVGQAFGPGTQAMFLQGAEGNVNHIDATDRLQGRGFKEAERIGSAVALAAASARFDAVQVTGPVAWSSEVVDLPPRRITPEEHARAAAIVSASAGAAPPPGQVDGIPDLLFARDQHELAGRTQPYPAEIQVFRIGDVAVVGLPGEFFVEFGLEIKKASPARITLVVGLANGSVGYVPTPAAFKQGGYEPTPWRYSKLAPKAGAICVKSAVRQLKAVFGQ
jgi:hypothetical protein